MKLKVSDRIIINWFGHEYEAEVLEKIDKQYRVGVHKAGRMYYYRVPSTNVSIVRKV